VIEEADKKPAADSSVADMTNEQTAVRFRQGAGVVRSNPLPVFAGVLGLVVLIRLILRRRNS
jgi:hypothetical protein